MRRNIYCNEYEDLKEIVSGIADGEDTETNVQLLAEHLSGLHESKELSSEQYEDLMFYIQDMISDEDFD